MNLKPESNFSAVLRYLIEEKGVSQKILSDKTGVAEATISRYINGLREPSCVEILYTMANYFDVSVDYLLGLTPVSEKQELSPEEKILINCYRKSSKDDTDVVWASLRKYETPNERLYLQSLNSVSEEKIG